MIAVGLQQDSMKIVDKEKILNRLGKLEEHLNEISNITKSQKQEIENILKDKVDYKHFYWIVGVLMTIVVGLFGVIYSKLSSIEERSVSVQNDVSFIQGKLQKAEITQ